MPAWLGNETWQIITPPAVTKLGEHAAFVVFVPFTLANTYGFCMGYCCEFEINSTMLAVLEDVFVPMTTSRQDTGVANAHEFGVLRVGNSTK
jgi:hypothetical protein